MGDRIERRLAAILAADIAGFSRLMGADEEGTLTLLKSCEAEVISPTIAKHRGRIFKTTGDGVLAEFSSAVEAVRSAVEMQQMMAERNASSSEQRRLQFRIGINVGDIMVDGGDIFGDGVNVAARLEGLAIPGGVCVSGRVQEDVQGRLDVWFEDVGEQSLKNIARPVRVYRVVAADRMPAITAPPALKLSIAVLPFQNLSNDPEQGYFSEGLTSNLTTDLSHISGMFVIASTTTATLKDKSTDVRQTCRELGVRYALQGGVQKTADAIRVNARLVDGQTGAQMWSERFDGSRADLFALQDQITARIAHSIGRELFGVAARDSVTRKINPDSADLFIRAVALADKVQTFDNMKEQERLFEAVVGIEPGNADAWARLGRSVLLQCVNFRGFLQTHEAEQKMKKGSEAVEKALELDPNNARAYLAEGLIYLALRNPAECARANESAIALDRNLALAHNNLSASLIHLGRPHEAIPIVEQAMRIDPLGPQLSFMQFNKGKASFLLGRSEEAIAWLTKSRRSNPNIARTLAILAACHAYFGNLVQAREIAESLMRVAPQYKLSESPDAPGTYTPEAYRLLFDDILLPAAREAGVPE
jgi:class 3 adenylate cyclase/tetratricopeptide (TPR) repeat protein